MRPVPRRWVAVGLACSTLLLPAALPAQGRMGAVIAITFQDGHEVWGELIAVKPDSLLIQSRSGLGQSVAFTEIVKIRITRRSRAFEGLLIGFLAGAVGGAIWGGSQSDDESRAAGAFLGGLVVAPSAGLAGMAVGWAAGIDTEVNFRDLSETDSAQVLAKLDRLANERGTYKPSIAAPIAGEPGPKPSPARLAGPRFRLTWMPGARFGRTWTYESGTVPFRFLDDLPPGESGPFDSTSYNAGHSRRTFSSGRLTLGYQWTQRVGAEIEFHTTGQTIDHFANLEFVSTIDGLDYFGYFVSREDVSATSLLAGLTFRPVPLATLQPHVVELGVAAGPAWIRTSAAESMYSREYTTIDRRTTWTIRGRVSYDFHFLPSASIGVFGEYRWLDASAPSLAITELLPYYKSGDYYNVAFTQTTEVTLPARKLNMGGFVCGVRLGVGF